ncbi:uncharacterized protein PpBr36_09800 [Pyricularia pennisetigena]|uniref:uncharacterized protein n=1 Tax=Pyricularia pennisetigena TaxID=1578925 RepID=UPI00115390C4|nr:uncharacterized protein PpBr36_09800 [Pyricularia pennisetigena]TLS22309.1 hypothetical protein PpBr36_09800 [Pyricularia pennisetigena]
MLLLVGEAFGVVEISGVDTDPPKVEEAPGEKVATFPLVPMARQGLPITPPLQIERALDVTSAVVVALVQIGLVVGIEVELPREPDKMQGPLISPPVHHGSAEEIVPVVAGNTEGIDVAGPGVPLTIQGPLISPSVQTGTLLSEGKPDDGAGRLSVDVVGPAVVAAVELSVGDVDVGGRVEAATEPLTTQGPLISPPVQMGSASATDVLAGGLSLMVVLVVTSPALELDPSSGDINDVEKPAVPLARHGPLIIPPVQSGRGLGREGTAVGAIEEVAFVGENEGDDVDIPPEPLTIQGPSITLPVHQGKDAVDAELELVVAMAVQVVLADVSGGINVDMSAVPLMRQGPLITPPVQKSRALAVVATKDSGACAVDSTAADVVDRRSVEVASPHEPLIRQGPLIIAPVHAGRRWSVGDDLNSGPVADITAVVLFVQAGSLVDVGAPEAPVTKQGPSMMPPVQYGSKTDVVVMSLLLLLLMLPSGGTRQGSVIGPPVHSGSDDAEVEFFVGSGRTLHGSDNAPPVQIGKVEEATVVPSVVVCTGLEVDVVGNDETRQGPTIRPPVHMGNGVVVTAQDPVVAPEVHKGGREVLNASVADVSLPSAVEVVFEALAFVTRDVLISSVNEVSIGSAVLPMQDPDMIPPVQAARDVVEVIVAFGVTVELMFAVVTGQDLNSVPVASLKHLCHELVQKPMVLVHPPPFPLVIGEGASTTAGVATDTLPRHCSFPLQPAEVGVIIAEVAEAVLACRVPPTGSAADVVNPESRVLVDVLFSDTASLLVASVIMLAEFWA